MTSWPRNRARLLQSAFPFGDRRCVEREAPSRRRDAKVVKTDTSPSSAVVDVIDTVILPKDKQAISWTLPFC
jgi:hypothetical protein